MTGRSTQLGLFLPNRGVPLGRLSVKQHLELAELAEQSPAIDSLWVGDSLTSKPRLEAIALLTALAARTERVKLGVSCMATFVQRHPVLFALQWASLDLISAGRSILAVCMGYPADQTANAARELHAMGIPSRERPARLVEGIEILRRLWAGGPVTYHGHFYDLEDVSLDVLPVQRPCPIFIASNPKRATLGPAAFDEALRRVARHADGWMTTVLTPEEYVEQWTRIQALAREEGRRLDPKASIVFYNLNLNDDPAAAYEETCAFLKDYFGAERLSPEMVRTWCAWGSAATCAAELQRYLDTGVGTVIIRMCSWNQRPQITRCLEEVLPRLRLDAGGPGRLG